MKEPDVKSFDNYKFSLWWSATHTIIAVMVHCYLGFNGLTCWFTWIVNIFENAYIIWACKTLSKCNIFSDEGASSSIKHFQLKNEFSWCIRQWQILHVFENYKLVSFEAIKILSTVVLFRLQIQCFLPEG